MSLSAALTRATDAIITGLATRRQPKVHLVDVLIDGESKPATLLLPATKQALTRIQELAQDLLGDTRQQYQQALNTTYTVDAEQRAEQEQRRNLLVGPAGLGLATAGVLVTPLFYLPSILCTLYVTRIFVQEANRLVFQEHRFNYRVVVALMTPALLAGGFIWPAAFGMALGLINKYLVVKTEHRAKRHVADLFGGQARRVSTATAQIGLMDATLKQLPAFFRLADMFGTNASCEQSSLGFSLSPGSFYFTLAFCQPQRSMS